MEDLERESHVIAKVTQICSEIGIHDVNDVLVTKAAVKKNIWEPHEKAIVWNAQH
jgi:hypothetical protein